jgi:hypothetical protein
MHEWVYHFGPTSAREKPLSHRARRVVSVRWRSHDGFLAVLDSGSVLLSSHRGSTLRGTVLPISARLFVLTGCENRRSIVFSPASFCAR